MLVSNAKDKPAAIHHEAPEPYVRDLSHPSDPDMDGPYSVHARPAPAGFPFRTARAQTPIKDTGSKQPRSDISLLVSFLAFHLMDTVPQSLKIAATQGGPGRIGTPRRCAPANRTARAWTPIKDVCRNRPRPDIKVT